MKVVFVFNSTTNAMRMEKICKENDIPGRIAPVPRKISASCGLCWIVPEPEVKLVLGTIDEFGLEVEGEYHLELP